VGTRYRYYGATPSFDEFAHRAWDSVLGQWLVVSKATRRPVGFTVISSADHRSGTAHFSVVGTPDTWRGAVMMDAMGVFFQYVFWAFPFRRLFAETAEDNLSQFASGEGRFFELEGCRREAIWLRGRYQDLHFLTVSRERWRDVGEPLHRRLMANADRDRQGEPTDLGAPDVGPSDVGPSDVGPSDVGPSEAGQSDLGAPDVGA
jgi:RimJ/RimL family protein N-acetyltransferase